MVDVLLNGGIEIPEHSKTHPKQLQQHSLFKSICHQLPFSELQIIPFGIDHERFAGDNNYTFQFVDEISHPPKPQLISHIFSNKTYI